MVKLTLGYVRDPCPAALLSISNARGPYVSSTTNPAPHDASIEPIPHPSGNPSRHISLLALLMANIFHCHTAQQQKRFYEQHGSLASRSLGFAHEAQGFVKSTYLRALRDQRGLSSNPHRNLLVRLQKRALDTISGSRLTSYIHIPKDLFRCISGFGLVALFRSHCQVKVHLHVPLCLPTNSKLT